MKRRNLEYKGVKFDSQQELDFGVYLETCGVDLKGTREASRLEYIVPEKSRKYTPDFSCGKYHVEYKGRLTKQDRDKLLFSKEHNRDERIILVFGRAQNTIRRGSKTTYGDWATKSGFEWYDKLIPKKRVKEIFNP